MDETHGFGIAPDRAEVQGALISQNDSTGG